MKSPVKKKCKAETGGGPVRVEKRVSRSINDMYARLLANGEIQNAIAVKADNNINKQRAVALMNNATVAPNYITNNELKERVKTVENGINTINKKKAQYKKQAEIKIEVDKILKEEGINR